MLVISKTQMAAFEAASAQRFVERLLVELERQFPELLAPLPRFVRLTMVGNGLDRSSAWGFTLESTLGVFVALQCMSSADFDRHPDVEALLSSRYVSEEQRLPQVMQRVSQAQWDEMRAGADIRAWFEPIRAEQQAARLAARVCATFPELLPTFDEPALRALFESATGRAARHGIVVEAGMCVFATALTLYGDGMDGPHGPRWARDIFSNHPPFSAAKIVALLRHAILLDTNRVI